MQVTFDVQSKLPEGMGIPVLSPTLAELIGSEFRAVGERVYVGEMDMESAMQLLWKLLSNPLITGVQATFEDIRR
jgi:hypothetical protein